MTKTCPHCDATVLSTSQPELIGTVTDEMVEAAWAAIVGGDIAKTCFNASIIRADLKTGLAAALAATPADDDAVLDSYAEENQRLSDQLRKKCAELASCSQHLDAAYEAAGLSKSSSKPLAYHIMELLAATPAVGGEALKQAEAAFEYIRLKLINQLNEPERSAFWKAVEARDAIRAAPPASPLRGIDVVARCMEILEDVPGEHLIDRVHRIVDWHQQLSEQYHDRSASPLRGRNRDLIALDAAHQIEALPSDLHEAQKTARIQLIVLHAMVSPPEQPAAPPSERKTLWGQINAVYGDLDAEDGAWIDREWMLCRGIAAQPVSSLRGMDSERCPTCHHTDEEYAAGDWTCADPWHADDHFRAKVASPPEQTAAVNMYRDALAAANVRIAELEDRLSKAAFATPPQSQ